jgi:hypothetical protein
MKVFTLTDQDIAVIARALGEVPYRLSAPVLNKLDEQVKAQMAKKDEPQPDTKEETVASCESESGG